MYRRENVRKSPKQEVMDARVELDKIIAKMETPLANALK
jgi:hypothetical protein